ncbi:Ionotropic receptor 574 [Blattella germanica]|nr:Ionotropic receptor 574 [Blattella germanica]
MEVISLVMLILSWQTPSLADKNIEYHLTECLHNIADKYITSVITFTFSKNSQRQCRTGQTFNLLAKSENSFSNNHSLCYDHSIIKKFQESFKWPLIIRQSMVSVVQQEHFSSYIIILERCCDSDVLNFLKYEVSKVKMNKYSKLIVAITQKVTKAKIIAENVLSILRQHRIVNTIVLMPSDSDVYQNGIGSSKFDVYTWFPYQEEGYCGNFTNPELLDRYISTHKGQNFLFRNALFPYKIPSNLHACPLVVSTFEYAPFVTSMKNDSNVLTYEEGIEVRFLDEFARRMNLTIKYREPSPDLWGVFLENGSWTGAAGEVSRGLSDMTIMGFWNKGDKPGLEYSTTYVIEHLNWFVPCAKPIPRWKSLIRVFKLSLWLGFLAAYVIVSKLMSLIAKWSNNSSENQAYSSFGRCLLFFWAIIVEESASNNPPNVTAIRLVFLTWVLYCLAVNTVYQTFLVSFLVDPGLEHQLSSETEIIESDLALGILESIGDCCVPNFDRYPRRDPCEDYIRCMDKMAFKNELALIFAQYNAEHFIHTRYMGDNGLPLVCKLPQEISIQFIATPFTIGSFFLEWYDKMVHCAIQAGLFKYWWDSLEYTTTLTTAMKFKVDDEYDMLSMEHLESAFIFLLLGSAVSSIIFVGEIFLSSNIWRKKLNIVKS